MGNVASCIRPVEAKEPAGLRKKRNLLELAKLNSTSLLEILDLLSWIDILHLMQVSRVLNIYIKSIYAPSVSKIDVAEILLLAACHRIKLPGRWDLFYDRATAISLCATYATKQVSTKAPGRFTDCMTNCLRSILRFVGPNVKTICCECIFKHLGPFQLVIQPHFVVEVIRIIEEYCSESVEILILPGKIHYPEIYWRTISQFKNLKELRVTLSEASEVGIEEMFEGLKNLSILNISSAIDQYPKFKWIPFVVVNFHINELDFKLMWDSENSPLIQQLITANQQSLKVLKMNQLQNSEDLTWLPETLPLLTHLQILHLGATTGSEAHPRTFCEALQKASVVAKQLKSLHLHGRYVTGRSIGAISRYAEELEDLSLTRGFTKGYEGFKGAEEIMKLKRFVSVKRLTLDFMQSLSEVTAAKFVHDMQDSIQSINLVCLYRLSTKVWTEIFKLKWLKSLNFECVIAGSECACSQYISKVMSSMIQIRQQIENRETLVVSIGPHVDVQINIQAPNLNGIKGVKVFRHISNMKIVIA